MTHRGLPHNSHASKVLPKLQAKESPGKLKTQIPQVITWASPPSCLSQQTDGAHYNIFQSSFTALKTLCAPLIHPLLPQPPMFLQYPWFRLFQNAMQLELYNIQPFQTSFFHLSICVYISSMSHHGLIAHFFVLNNISFSGITTVYSSTHLLEGQLGCCQVWAVMNKAAINICVQVFVQR